MNNRYVEELKIQYHDGFNCSAELCRIKCTLPHFHPHDIEFIYCLEGTLHLLSGEQYFSLEAGDFFSVDYNDIHFMHADEEALVLIFHINLLEISQDWSELRLRMFTCESTHCFPYQQPAMDTMKDLVLALASAQFRHSLSSEKAREAAEKMMKILNDYFDWFNYNSQDGYMNPDFRKRFYSSLEYCLNNYKRKITASELGELEHINPNYFSQFLATTVFNSFSHMVKYVRCFRAEHLLLSTDMPNYEIAYAVGFSDPKYFYSAFEYWWKCSPKEHRLKVRKQFELCDSTPDGCVTIGNREAANITDRYISIWHLKKMLR